MRVIHLQLCCQDLVQHVYSHYRQLYDLCMLSARKLLFAPLVHAAERTRWNSRFCCGLQTSTLPVTQGEQQVACLPRAVSMRTHGHMPTSLHTRALHYVNICTSKITLVHYDLCTTPTAYSQVLMRSHALTATLAHVDCIAPLIRAHCRPAPL